MQRDTAPFWRIVTGAACCLAIVTLISVGVIGSSNPSDAAVPAAAAAAISLPLVVPSETQVAESIGLSADVVTASGCNASDANAIMTTIQSNRARVLEIESHDQSIRDAGMALVQILAELDEDPLNADLLHQSNEARRQLSLAKQRASAARSALRELILEGLDQSVQANCNQCLSHAGTTAPPECRVLAWDAEALGELEQALIAERRANRMGEDLDDESARIIESARTDGDVIRASVNLDTHLSAVQRVYEQWR